jgi:ADP-heptose:LPS heptosyltransferase
VRILIVKFDATGDVLRTTCVLGPLKSKYPASYIVWVTRAPAVPVLTNLTEIDEVLESSADTLARIMVEKFDLLIHPDASPVSSAWAAVANARVRIGMFMDSGGQVNATNPAAHTWLLIGQNDLLKRANTVTYQEHILAACELSSASSRILVRLTAAELQFGHDFARGHGLDVGRSPIIGLNTGAGARWKYKKWTLEGYEALIHRLLECYPNAVIVLLGEKGEQDRNQALARVNPSRVVDAGPHPMREFLAIVNLCEVVVTGDTLGLHAALGLNKRVVAIFGPTSSAEVELYGQGEKIITPLPCRCCYLPDCDVQPTCMDSISVDDVFEAVGRQLPTVTAHSPT